VTNNDLPKSATALLAALVQTEHDQRPPRRMRDADADAELLIAADLAQRGPGGLVITAAGRERVRREGATDDPFRAQHLSIARRIVATPDGCAEVAVDDAESPLAWLARRKGRDGRALIEPLQLQAGERLRADFTRAQMMPRITANWTSSVAQDRRGAPAATFTEAVIGARQRLRHALDQVGPEFTGLLVDVCCFLNGLEDVERERGWPRSSAKVVLQLGLDRLARHYGYGSEARGAARTPVRTWLADDASFVLAE
jgi:hypothetical protein